MRALKIGHEGKDFSIVDREYEEYHGITLITTSLNEQDYIVDFANHFRPVVKRIVLIDGGSLDKTVELAAPVVDYLNVVQYTGSHTNMLNYAMTHSYTDWTLLMDPDERITDKLKGQLNNLIETEEFDAYSFPRREFLDGVENKTVYPDYQARLFRTYCRFIRPIHQELVGYKKLHNVPMNEDLDMIHSKKSVRHHKRNGGYRCFEIHLKHEIGSPGCQLKDSFEKEYPQLKFNEREIVY